MFFHIIFYYWIIYISKTIEMIYFIKRIKLYIECKKIILNIFFNNLNDFLFRENDSNKANKWI